MIKIAVVALSFLLLSCNTVPQNVLSNPDLLTLQGTWMRTVVNGVTMTMTYYSDYFVSFDNSYCFKQKVDRAEQYDRYAPNPIPSYDTTCHPVEFIKINSSFDNLLLTDSGSIPAYVSSLNDSLFFNSVGYARYSAYNSIPVKCNK